MRQRISIYISISVSEKWASGLMNYSEIYFSKIHNLLPNTEISAEPTTKKPKFLLVAAYFRSGSSFTAEIFKHHAGSFYVFEPLYYLWKKDINFLTFLNGSKLVLKDMEVRTAESVRTLNSCFHCHFEELAVEVLTHKSFLMRNLKLDSYIKCIEKTKKRLEIKKCLPYLKEECEKSSVRVVKIIRLSLSVLQTMLEKNANLKILHLIRDPRGILYSRKNIFKIKTFSETLKNMSTDLCQRMERNLNTSDIFKKLFPSRTAVVRYETVARSPVNEAKRLFKFLRIQPTFGDLAHVYCKAYSDSAVTDSYGTTRQNSSLIAYKWLKTAKFSDLQIIDSCCRGLYSKAGYLPIENEQSRSREPIAEDDFLH